MQHIQQWFSDSHFTHLNPILIVVVSSTGRYRDTRSSTHRPQFTPKVNRTDVQYVDINVLFTKINNVLTNRPRIALKAIELPPTILHQTPPKSGESKPWGQIPGICYPAATAPPIHIPSTAIMSGEQRYFHMHLVSDATGETLNTVARAATAHYSDYHPIEHIYALVRTPKQLQRVFIDIERQPGIVLFTLVNPQLRELLENHCTTLEVPCISILDPVIRSLAHYLNAESRPQVAAQHVLNAEYFRRIEALNYTMAHDDGQAAGDLESADVVLIGISRTSKTPTSIYLAQRAVKTANVPLVPDVPLPPNIENLQKPLVVGLIASAERVAQIRRHRLLTLKENRETPYTDPRTITTEIVRMKSLCAKHGWPTIDVTRRSVEETAATVLNMLAARKPSD